MTFIVDWVDTDAALLFGLGFCRWLRDISLFVGTAQASYQKITRRLSLKCI